MPFTPAHAAAALPFVRSRRARKYVDPLALLIGTTAPDFDYFLHGEMQGSGAHSAVGIVTFALPVTLFLWLASHLFVARAVWLSSPGWLRARVPEPRGAPAIAESPLVAVVAGALLGATTHVVWDAFTHAGGLGVELLPWLTTRIELPVLDRLRLYRVLQHGSTLAGLVVLAVFTVRWLVRQSPRPAAGLGPLGFVVPVSIAFGMTAGPAVSVLLRGRLHSGDAGHLVVAAIDGMLVMGLLSTAVVTLAAGGPGSSRSDSPSRGCRTDPSGCRRSRPLRGAASGGTNPSGRRGAS